MGTRLEIKSDNGYRKTKFQMWGNSKFIRDIAALDVQARVYMYSFLKIETRGLQAYLVDGIPT